MILLNQNTSNRVRITVTDNISLTATPIYYLFRFVDYTTNDQILFTTENVTTAITRYDEFIVTLTGSSNWQNLTGGTIYMEPKGEWRYEVYEQYSQTNLSLSGTSGRILEQGIVIVSGTPLTYTTQNYSGMSTTYSYYQP